MPFWGKKEKHTGFLHDLSDKQEQKLEEFKEEIEERELTNDPRFDDTYLLRFLRVNHFKLKKTVALFTKFLEWRQEVNADRAMVIYKVPKLPKIKEIYKHGYHKTDLEGRPVWIDHICQADIDGGLELANNEEMIEYYIREYERLIHIILPACSKAAGKKVETTFSIIDGKGFKMSMIGEKYRTFLKTASEIDQNYYPELLWKMLVINAPFMFQAAWQIIKPFLGADYTKKVHIGGKSYQKELFKYVDPDNLPTTVSGNGEGEEFGGDGFEAGPGPWNEYPGDEFGEAAKKELESKESDNVGEDDDLNQHDIKHEDHKISKLPINMLLNKNSLKVVDKKNEKKKSKKEKAKKATKKSKKKGIATAAEDDLE